MGVNLENWKQLTETCKRSDAKLVAVSKLKTAADIKALYEAGQLDFGENYVQELTEKQAQLPADINWHFIGHLQSNKVKYIAAFVHLVHGVDSLKLLQEINKQGAKHDRVIDCLLQVHIAQEETKFGLDEDELKELVDTVEKNKPSFSNIRIRGLMGMASFTEDESTIRTEFKYLKKIYDLYPEFDVLSMGMSGDYSIALEEGSTMVRIGSLLFGARN